MPTSTTRWSLAYAFGSGFIGLAELVVGWLSGSVALIADSVHALTDVLTGITGAIASKTGSKQADHNHPFGHSRAEPLGAFMVALITSFLGLNILQMGIGSLIEGQEIVHGEHSFWVLAAVISFKAFFYLLTRHRKHSKVLQALSIDSRNDCLASLATLFAIFASTRAIPWLEQVFALLLGLFILYSGVQIARENIAHLMGEIPEATFFQQVETILKQAPNLHGFNNVKAHYVGLDIHLAFNAQLSPELSLAQAHEIEHQLTEALMDIPHLSNVFIHTEPYFSAPTSRND